MGGNKWDRDWKDAGGGGTGSGIGKVLVLIDSEVDACKELNSVKAVIAFFVMLACYAHKKMLYISIKYMRCILKRVFSKKLLPDLQ